MRWCILAAAFTFAASATDVRVALKDDPTIESGLTIVAIGKLLSESCAEIRPRYLRSISFARRLKKRALDLGYSSAEIETYLDSDPDKARVKANAREYLRRRGANFNEPETLCAVGVSEITGETSVGKFLRHR